VALWSAGNAARLAASWWQERHVLDSSLAYGPLLASRLEAAFGPAAAIVTALETHVPRSALVLCPLPEGDPSPRAARAVRIASSLRPVALPRELVAVRASLWRERARGASVSAELFVLDLGGELDGLDGLDGLDAPEAPATDGASTARLALDGVGTLELVERGPLFALWRLVRRG